MYFCCTGLHKYFYDMSLLSFRDIEETVLPSPFWNVNCSSVVLNSAWHFSGIPSYRTLIAIKCWCIIRVCLKLVIESSRRNSMIISWVILNLRVTLTAAGWYRFYWRWMALHRCVHIHCVHFYMFIMITFSVVSRICAWNLLWNYLHLMLTHTIFLVGKY